MMAASQQVACSGPARLAGWQEKLSPLNNLLHGPAGQVLVGSSVFEPGAQG